MSLTRGGILSNGLARENGMAACTMWAPKRKLQRPKAGQRLCGGLNVRCHLTVSCGATIHEHGLISRVVARSIAALDNNRPDDMPS